MYVLSLSSPSILSLLLNSTMILQANFINNIFSFFSFSSLQMADSLINEQGVPLVQTLGTLLASGHTDQICEQVKHIHMYNVCTCICI